MSSDSDRVPKPSKRRRIIIPDSESSNESIVFQTHRRRKVYRVVSEAESSEEDSDVPRPVIRRKNYKVVSEDDRSYDSSASEAAESETSSEWQSDWDSMDELEEENEASPLKSKLKKKRIKPTDSTELATTSGAGFESDSSDGQSEKCPICLLSFKKQQLGTPSSCDHCFCLDCLTEWSKNINTCPVDRQAFTVIHVKSKVDGKVLKHIPIEVKPRIEDQIQEDPTYCEICQQCDREDRMLLCDGCDLGYHLECLTPQMEQVPMDEWYCPECSQNSQNDAEMVEIDLDEIPDLMEEARRLGVSYGRTRTGHPHENGPSTIPRVIPRTRQTERVRANIRADRTRAREVQDREVRERARVFDPDQPSTSSGIDSIGRNSPSHSRDSNRSSTETRVGPSVSSSTSLRAGTRTKRGVKQKRTKKQKVKSRGKTLVREVRLTEINDDGEEEEIVTYVKVAVPSASSSRRKRKKKGSKKPRKMKKHRHRARTVSSVSIQTVKRRLAKTLGMHKPRRDVPLLVPTMKNILPISGRSALVNSRYQSGISQVNLFGNNLSLDYSPPGSDEEFDSAVGNGPIVSAHPRSAVSATRRRIERLKGIANPLDRTDQPGVIDLVGSIISSQELWHSKTCDMTLKADGTLLVKNENKENKHSINNNESPIKEKKEIIQEKEITPKSERPLDLTNVNSSDIIQAPMYNNSRGGGNRGNFRGGYRDGGHHSHGGQGYGGRDSYAGGGRHSYGGPGPRDNFDGRDFGPPVNYNPNFEHRGPPPFSGSPPFRNRNPQHFRNERPRLPPTDRPPFPLMDGAERLPFHYPERFPRPRGPLNVPSPPMGMMPNPSVPMGIRPPSIQNNIPPNYHDDFSRNFSDDQRESFSSHVTPESVGPSQNPQDEEECDIYCDIETPNKSDSDAREESQNDSAIALLPPPEPPSGLLDFEGNSASEKDNDSDQELVIDDTPKEDTSKELTSDDKYDPFAADSDSNESSHGNKAPVDKPETCSDNNDIPIPLEPPPLPANFPALNVVNQAVKQAIEENIKPVVRLTAYDDDEDEDSQADCPNFSIYSSETMDVVRHTEQELSQQIGPLQPPPLPPDMPDDDDIIVGDVQPCDLADIPEPSDPYVEALQKERQTLSRIPPKKISNDSRGKITFKIGNKLKLNNKLSNLYDELDENIESTIEQEKQMEDKMSRDAKQNNKKPIESDLEKSEKASIEISTDKDKSGTQNKSEISNESDNKSDEEDEEKLQDLENQLKEKERKLREIEQQEEMEKQMDNQSSLKDREAFLEEELENEMSSKIKNDNKRNNSSLTDGSQNNNADSCLEKDTASKECSSTESKCIVSTIDLTEKSSDTIISIADTIQMSPKNTDNDATRADHRSDENRESDEARTSPSECGSGTREPDNWDQLSSSKGHFRNKSKSPIKFANQENDFAEGSRRLSDCEDKSSEKGSRAKTASESEDLDNSDPIREKGSSSFDADDDSENFPLEKDKTDICTELKRNIEPSAWESDGAYTPCKDELPVKGQDVPPESLSPFESGLEPITPTKDKVTDDLDGCRTPAGYAGLGTEAISETDEPMNFEDELALLTMRKEKEMEEGEIMDESKSNKKVLDKVKEKEDDSKKKKKKDKKEKGKDADKNKENIATENQVAWKKISKSTKERQYRDKDRRSKSKDKEKEKEKEKEKQKKKPKEVVKKKEKRKELPRYDVRKIVAEKPPRPRKDEYGRDIREDSRSRSKSRSLSHRRSTSRDRRSRSYSRMRSRSRSRSRVRRSWSKDRQSHSRPCRSLSRRRSISRLRRKSPRRRSSSKRRSLSRKRSVSRRRSRSLSRRRRSLSPRRRSGRRSLSRKRRTRSRSREKRKDKSKKRKSRSRSRNRKNSRSKSPKRASSRSREKKHTKRKRVSRSRSKERSSSRERDRNRNWDQVNEKPVERERNLSREREERRSWSAQWTPSWSRSRSKSPSAAQHDEIASHTWSPPPVLDNVAVPPKNLTVILTNKEAIKKKKKEKRKESKKSRETEKRKKNKRNRTPPPSKEVFASGDNILVSVCFNKDNETNQPELPEIPETLPLLVPTKRKRREPVHVEPPKRPKKDKTKDKRSKSPKAKKEKKKKSKAAEIAATKKPVAVIDLDQSPFREQTPSPRDVIVLSDDDDKQVQESATPEQRPSSQATPQHEQFVSQGPKTPPEPQVKFSITKQTSNLRTSMINPLHEEEEEEEEEIDERAEEELEMRAQEELELRLKVGPNTPPEPPSSPPTSPDVYDPFDPTKSRSPTPVVSQEATPTDERDRSQRNSPRKHDATDTPLMPSEPVQQLDQPNQEKQVEKPKIISMVTIKRASPKRDSSPAADNQTEASQPADSPSKSQPNQQNAQSAANPFATINPVLATVAAAVQRSTIFATSTPITGQRNLLQPNRISPSNQTKQRTNDRPQLPNLFTNPAKSTPVRSSKSTQNKSNSSMGQNGSDTTLETTNDPVDMSSPYSPGSSLSDGIFDPPSPGNYNSPSAPAASTNKNSTSKTSKPMEKKDAFDALFGTSPAVKTMGKGRSKKVSDKDKRKKSTNPKVGVRMDENQLQILDDLPSSAVEMQVKDKFLKKLNRQERVVEEVKLVLKPHYTKKHVTKEEYKDIMRKAVPKICHNKTGEINPKKIAQLIEAYVKKCRGGKKKTPGVSTNTPAKVSKPAKTLWS